MPQHDLRIGERPVTAAAGVAFNRGNKIGSTTHSRQVQDASYYLALLNTKKKQIEDEIMKLQSEEKEMETNRTNLANRQGSFDELLHEVRGLEETIAYYNLAYEKERDGADPEDVEMSAMDLKETNEELAHTVDQLFMENQCRLREINQVEHDISKTHESFQRLLESDQETSAEYERMTSELKCLKDEGTGTEVKIAELRNQMNEIQSKISKRKDSGIRVKYDSETEKVASLKTSLSMLDEELQTAQMGEDEARVYLLDKVKADKSKIIELDKEAKALEEEMRSIDNEEYKLHKEERNVESVVMSSTEKGNGANEKMYWRNEDARQYLLSSEQTVTNLQSELEGKKAIVDSLSEDLNKGINANNIEMPTKARFKSLSNDTAFKAKHLGNSKQTMKRLLVQKNQRKIEVRDDHLLTLTSSLLLQNKSGY